MVSRWQVASCAFVVALLSHSSSSGAMRQAGARDEPAATPSALPKMRMTPAEVSANQTGNNQIGSSGATGVSTKILFGDPSKSGFYVVTMFVPAHTTIQSHSHRDDRMATVVSGTWRFGYGDRFDERELKTLPPGSIYSEPGGANHFARTDTEPVLVEITGYGPTDTRYFDPALAPQVAPAR